MNSSLDVIHAKLLCARRIALWREAIGWETYWECPTPGSDSATIVAVKHLPDGRRIAVSQTTSNLALQQAISPNAECSAMERKLLAKISEAENEVRP